MRNREIVTRYPTLKVGQSLFLAVYLVLSGVVIAIILAVLTDWDRRLIIGGILFPISLFAFLVYPTVWAKATLFLSIATVSLSIYQIPLPLGQSLQIFRAFFLLAIGAHLFALQPLRARVPFALLPGLLFWLYAFVSTLLYGNNPTTSISLLVALAFACLYIAWFPQMVFSEARVRLVFFGIVAAGILVILFAAYQYFAWFTGIGREGYTFSVPFASVLGREADLIRASRSAGLFRLTLPFGSSSHLGPFIAAFSLITLSFQTYRPFTTIAKYLTLYNVVMFLLLLATMSRAAWLGWLIGLFVLLKFNKRITISKHAWRIIIVLLVILIVIVVLVPDYILGVVSRLDLDETQGSDETRIRFLEDALAMFLSNPTIGAGYGNYEYETGVRHAHNIYGTVLAELGLLGLGILLFWLASILWTGYLAIRNSRTNRLIHVFSIGLFAAFVSILVNNLFQESLYFGFTWVIAGLICAAYFIGTRALPQKSKPLHGQETTHFHVL